MELNLERSTWQLLYALYTDRVETESSADDEDMITDIMVKLLEFNYTIMYVCVLYIHRNISQIHLFIIMYIVCAVRVHLLPMLLVQ